MLKPASLKKTPQLPSPGQVASQCGGQCLTINDSLPQFLSVAFFSQQHLLCGAVRTGTTRPPATRLVCGSAGGSEATFLSTSLLAD